MGYREFSDANGVRWQAWDVMPQLVERRKGLRRARTGVRLGEERRRGADRRVMSTRRATLSAGFGQGWLCFDSGAEKRRLLPIPGDWLRCRVAQLVEYCRQAAPVRPSGEVRVPLEALGLDAPAPDGRERERQRELGAGPQ